MSDQPFYYVRWMGKVSGPFPADELRSRLAAGQISRHHQVSTDGQHWQSVSETDIAPTPKPALQVAVAPEPDEPQTARAGAKWRIRIPHPQPAETARDESMPNASIPARSAQQPDGIETAMGMAANVLRDGGGGWMTFLGIVGIVIGGVGAVFCIVCVIGVLVVAATRKSDVAPVFLIWALYGAPLIFVFVAGTRLCSAASKIKCGLLSRDTSLLNGGMTGIRNSCAALGWYFAIQIGVIAVIIVIALVIGISIGAMETAVRSTLE